MKNTTTTTRTTTTTTRTTRTIDQIVADVLKAQGLTSAPKNTASGDFRYWSAEQKDYAKTTVKPFRLAVCQALKAEYDTLMTGCPNADKVTSLLQSAMKEYIGKYPDLFFGVEEKSKSALMSWEVYSASMAQTGLPAPRIAELYSQYLLTNK